MSQTPYDQTRQLAAILLKREKIIDLPVIKKAIAGAMLMLPEPERADVDVEKLTRDLEASFSIWIGVETSLVDDTDHEPWLLEKKKEIDWAYWRRYQRFLEEVEEWSPVTVRNLDRLVDAVLEKLEDPNRTGNWDRRGLVAGHVQSGKTSNFTGLICKAVDAGYKLVVVLAGVHNSLRSQTQGRLDEGFLGYDSKNTAGAGPRRTIGVGALEGCPPVSTITTSADNGDFKTSVARNFHIDPNTKLLFVIKKNATVLKNLVGWIQNYANHTDTSGRRYVKDVPILVIDDEADNASVDTRAGALDEDGRPDPEYDPAVINGLIRRLLHSFARSAYVGYTATPFANIYIPDVAKADGYGEDLFPKSFIVNLPAPSNYIGPVQVFGLADPGGTSVEPLPLVTPVDDYLDTPPSGPRALRHDDWDKGPGWMPPKHKRDQVPRHRDKDVLPESLREALRAFILARAGRLARGQDNCHNSMLIHVSRFTDVQNRVVVQVQAELDAIQDEIEVWNGKADSSIIEELEQIWERRFRPAVDAMAGDDLPRLTWSQIRSQVKQAADGIRVKQINGSAGDVLEYREAEKTGLNVIAVGGDKLARGLTLEGLTVSYFLRATRLYDTLMQMGRWFGYHPGYSDLCRLYTSPDLVSWYVHVARANEELREMFDDMARRKLTPREYGLKVQAHPDGLLITAAAKMRYATNVRLSYDGSISETVVFEHAQTDGNVRAIKTFVSKLGGPKRDHVDAGANAVGPRRRQDPAETLVWTGVDAEKILGLLAEVRVPENGPHKARPALLAEFVQKHVARNELTEWTVGLVSNQEADVADVHEIQEARIGLVTRKVSVHEDRSGFSVRRLVSPSDEMLGFSPEMRDRALEITRESFRRDPGRGRYRLSSEEADASKIKTPNGAAIRSLRRKEEGLLLVYLIKPVDEAKEVISGAPVPVPGFALSFPSETTTETVDYVVNPVYWDQWYAN
jgi:hypothetical protein